MPVASSTPPTELVQEPLARAPRWSSRQRVVLWLVRHGLAPVIAVWTVTWRIKFDQGREPTRFWETQPQPAIYAFWHRCLLGIARTGRHRGFGTLISEHFDGEIIALVAQRMGLTTYRGSSTRGGISGLHAMTAALRSGGSVGITVDGPRGPRFHAKPGAVRLAQLSGAPLYAVHASMSRGWTFNSWDRFQLPAPFSRMLVSMDGPIYVEPDASDEQCALLNRELETQLETLRRTHDAALRPGKELS